MKPFKRMPSHVEESKFAGTILIDTELALTTYWDMPLNLEPFTVLSQFFGSDYQNDQSQNEFSPEGAFKPESLHSRKIMKKSQ